MVLRMTAPPSNIKSPPLGRSVGTLWGVGAERAAQLARVGVVTIEDLLLHRPRRYEDRRHFRPIAELVVDETALTRGKAVALGGKGFKQPPRPIFVLILAD